MGFLSNLGNKITIKVLLTCILISMWVLGIMILERLKEPVYVDSYYGSLPVEVTNYPSSSSSDVLPVEIVNTWPVDVNVKRYEAGEIPVSVENEFYDPVPIAVQ